VTTYGGRIEARCTVPTGGLTVSATNSGGGPTDCTVAAGNYYPTAAGSVSSIITALQTALNTSRAPASGSWTVTLSESTGLISIGCTGSSAIPSFSIDWSSTSLRDYLGFEYDIDYPASSAHIASVIGYGTWTAAWFCNESSGNLAAVFGAPTMAAGGTPTYSNQGPRGGADKAVEFNSTTDIFDGGNVHDIGVNDICLAWVAKFAATPAAFGSMISKINGTPSAGYTVYVRPTGDVRFLLYDAGGAKGAETTAAGAYAGEWHVGIACVDRSTGKMRIGTRGLTSGTSDISAEVTISGDITTAETFTFGDSDFTDSANFQLAAVYVGTGSGAATGLSANLSTALANFAGCFSTWTGTLQCRGVWIPDWPLQLDGDPEQAPTISDLRTSQSPTGVVLGLSGNTFYRHTGLVYSHVARDRVWESAATYDHASWEWFFRETQLGLESSLFTPASPLQIYWNNAGTLTLLGDAANDGAGTDGWTITGLGSVEPRPSQANYTGLFRIELGTVVSEG
jgi:hypothetical protein